MNYRLLFLWLIMLWSFPIMVNAQPLSAYVDIQRNFTVFDAGMVKKVENLQPLDFKIGKISIPYIDNSRNFKIYSQGNSFKINEGFTNAFQVTDNLVAYFNANALWVWEEGESYLLSGRVEQYYIGDSIVLFFDGVQKEFKAYYDGQIYPIENYLGGSNRLSFDGNVSANMSVGAGQLPVAKVSANIAAYVDYAERFRYFKQGQIYTLEDYLVQSFDVGRSVIAYVDANGYFKVFYNGEVVELDSFAPQLYAAGNEMVAFWDHAGYFKIFYKGEVYEVGFFEGNFKVQENVISFSNSSGQFLAFYQGSFYTLENYTPTEVKIGYNSIGFIGAGGALKMFSKGKIYEVSRADLQYWSLDYDVLTYQFGRNLFKVFYEGQTY